MIKQSAVVEQDLENLSSLFRLLSDKTRLNILMFLAEGERNVTKLCEMLALPQPTVSHHLGLLRMNNLIGNRRNGKQVFYMLNGRVDATDKSGLRINIGNCNVHIGIRGGTNMAGETRSSDADSDGHAEFAPDDETDGAPVSGA